MDFYDSSGQPAGGVNFYCFDDITRGIAYGVNVNGDAYLTDKPDSIIVHAPRVPYIPLQGLTNVTRVTGPISRLYQNETQADQADALETKLNASRAKSHRKH